MTMASFHLFILLAISAQLLNLCFAFHPKRFNVSIVHELDSWSPAVATWYGSPSGGGSTGGACGYGDAVEQPPFSSMVSAGGPSLFKSGKGCGTCFQVKCTGNAACSGNPVTVVIIDECPGGPCASDPVHFDLSGAAMGALANSGQADQLRNAGSIQIQYQRVACNYPGVSVAFRVDEGSNPFYFATAIEYENGDGDLASVELQPAGQAWLPMQQSHGAIWKVNSGSTLKGPFSIKLTSIESRKSIVATNVIPADYKLGQTYRSVVNF